VCRVLAAAGHQAVTVGGAVRDALLGRAPGDWDVATSARPDQVMALFKHTIPTGMQHGTVTVVTGRGADTHVEVTSFRGEGAYSDARRPDAVVFGVPLTEDLARRDLVVNAIAYDPSTGDIHDPFGGREDLAARRLRAVGNAVERFTEDGLRVMRAVRFAAQLEFELDPATENGIAPALPSLAKVSRERVCDELRKILGARQPSRALVIARRTGILNTILPALDAAIADEAAWLERVDRVVADVRLAALLVPLSAADAVPLPGLAGARSNDADVEQDRSQAHLDLEVVRRVAGILRALKFSNIECDLAAQLVGVVRAERRRDWSSADVRRLLAELDRDKRLRAADVWVNDVLAAEARRVLDAREPLSVADLAVTGKDVMVALDQPPGPAIGRILGMLLERVLEDPTRNTRDRLLAEAQQLELEVGHEES
jgi:tRNA nucleotidyltransferase (CCA-adding enzyme)